MPILGGLLVSLFGGIVGWLAQYFTRKVAFGAAAVVTYSALTLALYVAMRGTFAALEGVATGVNPMFLEAVRLGIPPVAPACLGAYITTWTACTVYAWQRDLMKVVAAV
jgi:hypothetical protein